MTQAAKTKHRLDYVDALRGIAASLVVVKHLGDLQLDHMVPGPAAQFGRALVSDLLDPGKIGVVAFFAISGFVIPFSFRGDHPLRSFVITRFFRLYPAYWLSLAVAVALFPLLAGDHFTVAQIAANVTMIQAALRQPDCIGVYWTLFIELAFYAICYIAFATRLLKYSRYILGMIGGLYVLSWIAAIVGRLHHQHAPMSLILGLMVMHVGTLTRMRLIEQDPLAERTLGFVLAAVGVGLIPVCWYGWSGGGANEDPWLGVTTGYLAGLGLFLYCVLRKAFANRVTIYLGAISYALYLFHPLGLKLGSFLAASAPPALSSAIAILTTVFVGVGVSALVFHFIEKPAIDIGHRLSKKARWASQPPAG